MATEKAEKEEEPRREAEAPVKIIVPRPEGGEGGFESIWEAAGGEGEVSWSYYVCFKRQRL